MHARGQAMLRTVGLLVAVMVACTWSRHAAIVSAVESADHAPEIDDSVHSGGAPGPSVLFASPAFGTADVWIDLDYLTSLHNDSAAALQVDYTSSLTQLNRSRIFQYNAIVLFHSVMAPGGDGCCCDSGGWCTGGYDKNWAPMIADYVGKGGGLFLFPSENNVGGQQMFDLMEFFEVKLPAEVLVESNRSNLATLEHAATVTIAYTDIVNRSHPVSNGVRSIWHAIDPAYNAAQGSSIYPTSDAWDVLINASPTVQTQNVNLTKPALPPPPKEQIFQRTSSVQSPPLFACRSYLKGRVCITNQWRQFSVGSGAKWIFDNQVLSKGVGNRPSDFGRLLRNTYHWLSEPSASDPGAVVGGFVNSPNSLRSPNLNPAGKLIWSCPLPTSALAA